MKIYNTQEEVNADVKNECLNIYDDVIFNCNIYMSSININAYNINAYNINANNINANDINANDINANNIDYYAFCISYNNIECLSIKGRRKNSFHKCLDGKLTIKHKKHVITIDGKNIELSKESFNSLKEQLVV